MSPHQAQGGAQVAHCNSMLMFVEVLYEKCNSFFEQQPIIDHFSPQHIKPHPLLPFAPATAPQIRHSPWPAKPLSRRRHVFTFPTFTKVMAVVMLHSCHLPAPVHCGSWCRILSSSCALFSGASIAGCSTTTWWSGSVWKHSIPGLGPGNGRGCWSIRQPHKWWLSMRPAPFKNHAISVRCSRGSYERKLSWMTTIVYSQACLTV